MARMLLALGILLLFAAIVSAQAPDTLWTRTYGGSDYESPGWIEPAHDGGFVVAGYTRSFGVANDDMYIVKINADGSTGWAYTYGDSGTDDAYDIKRTRDGGYIIAGWSNSGGHGAKYRLVKITVNGEFLWQHDYGPDSSTNYGFGVCQTLDGGFVIVGQVYYHGNWGYDWDPIIIKTDEDGNVINQYQINKQNSQYAFKVIATQDSGAMMVRGTGSFWFAKLNSNGDTVWTRSYGGSADCNSIIQLHDGGYAAFGDRDRGYPNEEQFWLIRLNANGDSLWSKYYGGVDPDDGYCVAETYDHGFIMVGHMYPTGQPFDISIVRADSMGEQLWSSHYGNQYDDFGVAVQCTPDSGYIVLGRTAPNSTMFDYYVIRLAPDTLINNGISEESDVIPSAISLGQNYPNPFNANTNIEYSILTKSAIRIDVYDILGRKVATLANDIADAGVHRVTWNAAKMPSGTYFYRLSVNGLSAVKEMLFIK
jgi:flagellar hook assembly protein FlgD